MHVEERHAFPFAQRRTIQPLQRTAHGVERTSRHVAGNDGIGNAAQPSVPEVDVGAADLRALGAQQRGARRQLGSGELADLERLPRGHHHGGQDALIHRGTLPLMPDIFQGDAASKGPRYTSAIAFMLSLRTILAAVVISGFAVPAAAQDTYSATKPRRQFITVSVDWLQTEPLHFASHPLEDLVGREVAAAQGELYDYRTRDEQILIDILEFRKRNRAASVALYPFGLSIGTTLGLRASVEEVPTIRINFDGPGAPANYELTGARAYDVGAGLYVADRSPGW